MHVITILFVVAVGILFGIPAATAYDVGDTVELKATNPAGVPLHREARSSMFGRAPHGATGIIFETANSDRWLHLTLDDGRTAWIVEKYVAGVVPGNRPAVDTGDDEIAVWSTPAQCEAVVNAGRRLPRDVVALRIATWNIRWFPDGEMAPRPNNQTVPTDTAWLACAVAWMNVDVVALQEIRTHSGADDAWESILDDLEARTGSTWAVGLQGCGSSHSQHVGYLWNTARVSLQDREDLWRFNARADDASNACESNRRPGHYARASSTATPGVDLHMITVHLKSGPQQASMESRTTSLNRINESIDRFVAVDSDVIILGDFNTMGVTNGTLPHEEIANMTQIVANEAPGFDRLQVEPACTEYFRGHGGWLDHVLISQNMSEAQNTSARVTGYCAIHSCDRLDEDDMPRAYRSLSDHCPVIIDIANHDQD